MRDLGLFFGWTGVFLFVLVCSVTIPAWNWPMAVPESWSCLGRIGIGVAIFIGGEILWFVVGLAMMWVLGTYDSRKEGVTRV